MIAETDIWTSARILLDQRGLRAPEHCSRRISELTMAGDRQGAEMWGDIMAAVAALRLGRDAAHAWRHLGPSNAG